MENRIELKFDKMIVDLTGNKFGRNVFREQVEVAFREDMINIIVIPEVINDIGSSFVQGMYSIISEKYGKAEALQMMKFDCRKTEIIEKVRKAISTYGIK